MVKIYRSWSNNLRQDYRNLGKFSANDLKEICHPHIYKLDPSLPWTLHACPCYVFLFLWSRVPLVYLFLVLFSRLITDIQERLKMEDTGRILLFLALILATARRVHAIYYKEAAGELQSYIVHIDPTKVQIPDSMNPAT